MLQDFLLPLLLQAADAPVLPAAGGDAPAANPLTGSGGILVPMLIVCGIIYLIIIRPDAKKRKALELELKTLKKGDQVATIGGILGKVWRADGNEVELLIDRDEQMKVRFKRAAVSEIIRGEASTAAASEPVAKESKESAKA